MYRRGFAPIILLIVAAILAVGIGGYVWFATPKGANAPSAPAPQQPAASTAPTPPPTVSATPSVLDTSKWQTYSNNEYGFTLKYPPGFQIEGRSSANSQYKTDFRITSGTSTVPLSLQVTDLDKYLPLTNAPTIPEYVQTFSGLDQFKKTTINHKGAYEYLICGSASCSQEVVFIHNNIQYEFSISYKAYFPGGQISGDVGPRSITFESSPIEIQRIIGSLEFHASPQR